MWRDMLLLLHPREMCQTVNNQTDSENHEKTLVRLYTINLYVAIHKTSYILLCIHSCVVVSTEQYQEPPLFDLRFPDKLDLINYTMNGEISEITIPPSLVQERLGEMTSNGTLLIDNAIKHNLYHVFVVLMTQRVFQFSSFFFTIFPWETSSQIHQM